MTTAKDATSAPWEETTIRVSNEIQPNIDAFSEFSSFGSVDALDEADDDLVPPEKEPLIDEIALEYVGFWNALVSKTNWEKGKVIHQWRAKLIEEGLPRRIYSDETIAQRIGNVSPQHVGRLRRVYERFGESEPLPNLYWSHYQAALDWEDADEWLSKASSEKLSVAQTRIARWEKTGAKLSHKPKEEDIVDSEKDEDVNPYNDSDSALTGSEIITPTSGSLTSDGSKKKSKKKKDAQGGQGSLGEYGGETEPWEGSSTSFTTSDVLDAISQLATLPEDLSESLEAVKIAILSHKLTGWKDVQPEQIAAYLSEFKRLLISEETKK